MANKRRALLVACVIASGLTKTLVVRRFLEKSTVVSLHRAGFRKNSPHRKGFLKKSSHKAFFLKKSPYVESYRLGVVKSDHP